MMKLKFFHRTPGKLGVARLSLMGVAFAAAVVCAWNALVPAGDGSDVLDGRTSGLLPTYDSQSAAIAEANSSDDSSSPVAREPEAASRIPAAMADPQRLAQLNNSLLSGPVDDQIEAIKVFAKVGTPEQKAVISQRAADPGAEMALRVAAIENLDWTTQLNLITQLMRNETSLGEAILYIAEGKQLPPQSVAQLEQAAVSIFPSCQDAASQLAVLHFLSEYDPQQFDALAGQVSVVQFSPAEYEDFAQLLETRREEQQILQSGPQMN